ncbi:MAG TPA: hypothetical protein VK689_10055 [Armatimonadota bacterium]|nr:hypothetical protein [Armatimonadota bacterium]
MKRQIILAAVALLCAGGVGVGTAVAWRGDRDDDIRDRRERRDRRNDDFNDRFRDPDLETKLVPIITVGSSINVGIAQVAGEEQDVDRVRAVAQIETDYKNRARIKILVPVQSENVVQNIDRVPGVSVTAIGDYAIKR